MITTEDRLAITALMARYNIAADIGDGMGRAATFLPDGVYQGSAHRLDGRGAIAANTNDAWASPVTDAWGNWPGECQHWTTNTIVEGRGTSARAESYVAIVSQRVGIVLLGRYLDDLRKVDGHWLFQHRTYVPMPKRTQPTSRRSH